MLRTAYIRPIIPLQESTSTAVQQELCSCEMCRTNLNFKLQEKHPSRQRAEQLTMFAKILFINSMYHLQVYTITSPVGKIWSVRDYYPYMSGSEQQQSCDVFEVCRLPTCSKPGTVISPRTALGLFLSNAGFASLLNFPLGLSIVIQPLACARRPRDLK